MANKSPGRSVTCSRRKHATSFVTPTPVLSQKSFGIGMLGSAGFEFWLEDALEVSLLLLLRAECKAQKLCPSQA